MIRTYIHQLTTPRINKNYIGRLLKMGVLFYVYFFIKGWDYLERLSQRRFFYLTWKTRNFFYFLWSSWDIGELCCHLMHFWFFWGAVPLLLIMYGVYTKYLPIYIEKEKK